MVGDETGESPPQSYHPAVGTLRSFFPLNTAFRTQKGFPSGHLENELDDALQSIVNGFTRNVSLLFSLIFFMGCLNGQTFHKLVNSFHRLVHSKRYLQI